MNETLEAFGHDEKISNNILIIGGGNVGFNLAKNIEQSFEDARLKLIEKDKELSKLPILVNDEMASHQIESLKILGISNDQLIKFPSTL